MLETIFANPLNLFVGGALISAPIIIHLLNQLRYKRVRWAAMEFLLRSQKRNRRRLIIEQILLLLLRILLVLLAGLLLANFRGCSTFAGLGAQNSLHVVLLDDRLSMSDQWKTEDGTKRNSFQTGKQLVSNQIARTALGNRSSQRLLLRRLSEPGTDLFDQRLNDDTVADLGSVLARMEEGTSLHLDLERGVRPARELLEQHAKQHSRDQRFLYIVSDFRQRHWFEPEAKKLIETLDALAKNDVQIRLVDAADPKRTEQQKMPPCHDNLAVVDLRSETRLAAQHSLVQFKIAVANYGVSERQNVRVTVKVNGSDRPEASQTLPSVPAGRQPVTATFLIAFDQLGFNQVTANLENEDFGLPGDNARFAVIEVRKQVPVLVIDGDLAGGDKPGGDTFHLRTLFNAAKGYEVVRGGTSELERPNLEQYASIYLLNVRELANDKQLKNLEDYVREGGGVAFFLGDRVTNSDYYNKKLYAGGAGIFPAPLADHPSPLLGEEEKRDKLLQNLLDPQFQLLIRKEDHPLFDFDDKVKTHVRLAFKFLTIDRYYPVPRQRWPRRQGVEELLTLPNNRPVSDYESTAQDIARELVLEDPKYAPYRPGLEKYRRLILDKAKGKALSSLAAVVDALLKDRGSASDPDQPNLEEFWKLPDPKIEQLRRRIDAFRETIQYGDPLLIAGTFGKGRTVAVLTSAGKKWNDWAGGSPASFTYPMLVLEMQKYLSSLGSDADLLVGDAKQFEVDASRYVPEMRCYYQPEARAGDPGKPEAPGDAARKTNLEMRDVLSGVEANGRLKFEFDKAKKPGIYYFEMTERASPAQDKPRVESRAFAFNVDTDNESDLRRASRSDLENISAKEKAVQLSGAAGLESTVSDRKNDLSENPWFYLFILFILVIEQALAVHLSFHLKGNEAQPPPAVRARPTLA